MPPQRSRNYTRRALAIPSQASSVILPQHSDHVAPSTAFNIMPQLQEPNALGLDLTGSSSTLRCKISASETATAHQAGVNERELTTKGFRGGGVDSQARRGYEWGMKREGEEEEKKKKNRDVYLSYLSETIMNKGPLLDKGPIYNLPLSSAQQLWLSEMNVALDGVLNEGAYNPQSSMKQRRHKVRLSPHLEIARVEEPLYPDVIMRVEEPPLPLVSLVTRAEIPNRYIDEFEYSHNEIQGAPAEAVLVGEDGADYVTASSLLWS